MQPLDAADQLLNLPRVHLPPNSLDAVRLGRNQNASRQESRRGGASASECRLKPRLSELKHETDVGMRDRTGTVLQCAHGVTVPLEELRKHRQQASLCSMADIVLLHQPFSFVI